MRGAGPGTPRTAYLGLGTNIGDRAGNLTAALAALPAIGAVMDVSNVYQSEAMGYTDQPFFWNLAVKLGTHLAPLELLAALKELERRLGRTPTFRMGPRTIDIDILFYEHVVVDTPELRLPHAGVLDRPFVLRPLLDLEPDMVHVVTGESLANRAAELAGHSGLRRIGRLPDLRGCRGPG